MKIKGVTDQYGSYIDAFLKIELEIKTTIVAIKSAMNNLRSGLRFEKRELNKNPTAKAIT